MSEERVKRLLRAGRLTGAAIITLCVVVLLTFFVVATVRAPKDDRYVKSMEKQVKQDAAIAPKLLAEKTRIANFRLLRRRTGEVSGWVLLAASALFLGCARLENKKTPPAPRVKVQETRHSAASECTCEQQAARARAAEAPPVDLGFVEKIVGEIGRTREVAIPLLQAIQTHYRYLPDAALQRLCELTDITPAEIAGTSTFYGQFRRSPVGEHIVRVCHGTACHVSGATQVSDELRRYLAIPEGQDTDADRQFTIEEVACLGCCSLAPVLMVDDHTVGKLTPATAREALKAFEKEPA
jgi:NADH:ubiquinone oxidoreductase subunit E